MQFKCGIIGLGRIGCGFDDNPKKETISTHAGAYSTNKKANLVALCDIDNNKLVKYGKKYHASGLYTDYKNMFKNEQLDCVSICTLADSHLEIVKETIKYNVKGIFLEKPISTNLKDASKIVKLCKENRTKLQIDHQRRFDPFYHTVRDLINDKKFGRIQHVGIYYGSGIANTGSHIFDLLMFFFGKIQWVEGVYSQNPSNNPSDPNLDGKVGFSNITCTMQGFDLKNYGILEFDILGTNARIRLNITKSTAEYFEVTNNHNPLVYHSLKSKLLPLPKKVDAIVRGLDNLFYSIEHNTNPSSSGEDGYFSLEAILAMSHSANKNGRRIYLPLKTNTYKIYSK